MKAKLFNVVVPDNESVLDRLVTLPGWSHWSQPFSLRVFYYPFQEHCRTAYFYAAHRREAAKLIGRLSIHCLRPISD